MARDAERWSWVSVWQRFSFMQLLDWPRNCDTKPRELAGAKDDLTNRLCVQGEEHPGVRLWACWMLAALGLPRAQAPGAAAPQRRAAAALAEDPCGGPSYTGPYTGQAHGHRTHAAHAGQDLQDAHGAPMRRGERQGGGARGRAGRACARHGLRAGRPLARCGACAERGCAPHQLFRPHVTRRLEDEPAGPWAEVRCRPDGTILVERAAHAESVDKQPRLTSRSASRGLMQELLQTRPGETRLVNMNPTDGLDGKWCIKSAEVDGRQAGPRSLEPMLFTPKRPPEARTPQTAARPYGRMQKGPDACANAQRGRHGGQAIRTRSCAASPATGSRRPPGTPTSSRTRSGATTPRSMTGASARPSPSCPPRATCRGTGRWSATTASRRSGLRRTSGRPPTSPTLTAIPDGGSRSSRTASGPRRAPATRSTCRPPSRPPRVVGARPVGQITGHLRPGRWRRRPPQALALPLGPARREQPGRRPPRLCAPGRHARRCSASSTTSAQARRHPAGHAAGLLVEDAADGANPWRGHGDAPEPAQRPDASPADLGAGTHAAARGASGGARGPGIAGRPPARRWATTAARWRAPYGPRPYATASRVVGEQVDTLQVLLRGLRSRGLWAASQTLASAVLACRDGRRWPRCLAPLDRATGVAVCWA